MAITNHRLVKPPLSRRAAALSKVALISAASIASPKHEFNKIASRSLQRIRRDGPSRVPKIPMSSKELEVLVALCSAAPIVSDLATATDLVDRLGHYLCESHSQVFAVSPFLKAIEPCPWDFLTKALTRALLSIGLKHASLHRAVHRFIISYLTTTLYASKSTTRHPLDSSTIEAVESTLSTATVVASLSGFLHEAARHADFFTMPEVFDMLGMLKDILSEEFMIAVEGVFSSIKSVDATSTTTLHLWKTYAKMYAASGWPIGAMLLQCKFMRLLVSVSALLLCTPHELREHNVLELLSTRKASTFKYRHAEGEALTFLMADAAHRSIHLLDEGADYLQLGSAWQQRLACSVRACSIQIVLNCRVADGGIAEDEILLAWVEDVLSDPYLTQDDALVTVALKSAIVIALNSPSGASTLSRTVPRFIVQSSNKPVITIMAAECFACILRYLGNDAVISGLYSIGNVLSVSTAADRNKMENGRNGTTKTSTGQGQQQTLLKTSANSDVSFDISKEDDLSALYIRVVLATVSIARFCKDAKIVDLAQSMLLQKFSRINATVDTCILRELATLAAVGNESELLVLLKLYNRMTQEAAKKNDKITLEAIRHARISMARTVPTISPLFRTIVMSLLETIISKGDIHESENTRQSDVDLAAIEINELLPPWAAMRSAAKESNSHVFEDAQLNRLERDAWFNVVVHGIHPQMTPNPPHGLLCVEYMKQIASMSKPLVDETRADQLDADVELNAILRRGMSPQRTAEQKKILTQLLPTCEADIRALSHPKVVFLIATQYMENLRATSGDCTQLLTYFVDTSLQSNPMGECLTAIAMTSNSLYIERILADSSQSRTAPLVAQQLKDLFVGCCHRVQSVQRVAIFCANTIIARIPSALCRRTALFSLLELVSLMWKSCLDAELDEYGMKSTYVSQLGGVTIQLPDDLVLRKATLNKISGHARGWILQVINIAPLDVKGLLQTYLAAENSGAEGYVALGRTFALELGSALPNSDPRSSAVEEQAGYKIDAGSEFMAQYTARQEYKFADALPDYGKEWAGFLRTSTSVNKNDMKALAVLKLPDLLKRLHQRALDDKFISIAELRDLLRRAAGILNRAGEEQCSIIQYLVEIPFAILNKHSIKLGVSLWLGIINEYPRLEPMVLSAVAVGWKRSMKERRGLFSPQLRHLDPLYVKLDYAPSSKDLITRQQQTALNLIAPHMRVLHFISSHFSSSRLGSPHMQRCFQDITIATLESLKSCAGHPLAREFHFQAILLGLDVFQFCTGIDSKARWRLKDLILSGGLSWFSHRASWSYGGNRLQLKADINIMDQVLAAFAATASRFAKDSGPYGSLALKQDLLCRLIEHERFRLSVWLFPLEQERRHLIGTGTGKGLPEDLISVLVRTAWSEGPSIAVQMTKRFPSIKVTNEVRTLLLRRPDLAVHDAEALQLLLGPSLPTDVSFQLKYLLYWMAVNPVTAITYFMPEYETNPYIIQYAMRALEAHSVDVTFIYVPQIVQTLRYDVLRYVQRYIIETAKLSQLFAHQIIWNMTANAYKDEDSTIPDSLKPTLDLVRRHMIDGFSTEDRVFYDREFAFFDEVTSISGKLRPYIKRSKPEKKQKIEEELRKIKVEVGVYLPSNPEGTVIGIDRKSGKPLQSHAKAPYMATFRIKKTAPPRHPDLDETVPDEEERVQSAKDAEDGTLEVWQSAIFKVGDDCRQDLLALQLIAAFRGIFSDVGLDVYVFPYRVTATAPGCGVIDVLPNAISRDMLGRETVNGLYDYFVSKYGGETSITYQQARNNFVKSMAAYSVISYLLQFKDRHNGNIMIDDEGHILHIDFGFCFDIAPGGVRFERAPFKLTAEMVAVMGGRQASQSYRFFEELCIKAFLASRQHAEKLCHIVVLMLGSGLPCFKPETIAHLRQRFVLEKTEREAADFMKDLIKKSQSSYSTGVYDQFQLMTNGIPY